MADYGQTASCCQRMSAEELNEREAEGRPLNCVTCEYRTRHERLWAQNAEAFAIYRALCGRTVALLEMQGWMFQRLTDRLSPDEQLDMLARLDVIHAVLSPDERGRGANGGST